MDKKVTPWKYMTAQGFIEDPVTEGTQEVFGGTIVAGRGRYPIVFVYQDNPSQLTLDRLDLDPICHAEVTLSSQHFHNLDFFETHFLHELGKHVADSYGLEVCTGHTGYNAIQSMSVLAGTKDDLSNLAAAVREYNTVSTSPELEKLIARRRASVKKGIQKL